MSAVRYITDLDPRILRQTLAGEARDDLPEERGRDLEVEDRHPRALDRLGHSLVRCGVAEVAVDVREPAREALEDLFVELLPGRDDRVVGPLDQVLERPVVERDAHDRTAQEASLLQAVERAERHHAREVARDPEDHEDVGSLAFARFPA